MKAAKEHKPQKSRIISRKALAPKTIQCHTIITWPQTQPYRYGYNLATNNFQHQINGVGRRMHAKIDATDPRNGSAPGGGNIANVRNEVQNSYGGRMILGHLLNDNIGGPGLEFNLFPISVLANAEHSSSVETYVKNAVMRNIGNHQGEWPNNTHVEYIVEVIPTDTNAGTHRAIQTTPDANINCWWREYNGPAIGWGAWNYKIIHSIAGDDYLPINGNWGSIGNGARQLGHQHIQLIPNPQFPLIIGRQYNIRVEQTNGVVIGYLQ